MKLNPDDISSINVLKDQAATMLYGKEVEDGVIKVYTKIYIKKYPEETRGQTLIYKPHLVLFRMNC